MPRAPSAMDLPECPVYSPSPAEFRDPIGFISRIRTEAEPFGMCRIVPPPGWSPPFALDKHRFRFRTKLQELHHLQERPAGADPGTFKLEYLRFCEEHGQTLATWPRFEGKELDLCRLFNAVRRRGGFEAVARDRKWADVAHTLFPERSLERSHVAASQLQGLYRMHLLEYETHLRERLSARMDAKKKSKAKKSRSAEPGHAAPAARGAGGDGAAEEQRRSKVAKMLESLVANQERTDQRCQQCHGATNEAQMLLCDRCNSGYHLYCLSPPLQAVPPGNWYCPGCVVRQNESFGFSSGGDFSIQEFRRHDEEFRRKWFGPNHAQLSSSEVEEEFWRIVEGPSEPVEVLYGSDLDVAVYGSGFPRAGEPCPAGKDEARWAEYARHPWNVNVMAKAKNSMLRFVDDSIPGVIVPWLYMGMTFSSFCWHFEDHCFYSISYLHWGSPKIWYGVPGCAAEDFERVMRGTFPDLFEAQPDLLFHLVTMLHPMVLKRQGVPVFRTAQGPGEFVITFPRSYHGGLNQGLNCAEAVNFAPAEWLSWSRIGMQRYRLFRRKCIISHEELLCVALLNKGQGECQLDPATLAWLRAEGESILREERALREHVWAQGTVRSRRMAPHKNAAAITDEEDAECIVCRYYLYLSAVTCPCRPSEPVCLEHAQNLCDCPSARRTLLFRWSLAEIEDLLASARAPPSAPHSQAPASAVPAMPAAGPVVRASAVAQGCAKLEDAGRTQQVQGRTQSGGDEGAGPAPAAEVGRSTRVLCKAEESEGMAWEGTECQGSSKAEPGGSELPLGAEQKSSGKAKRELNSSSTNLRLRETGVSAGPGAPARPRRSCCQPGPAPKSARGHRDRAAAWTARARAALRSAPTLDAAQALLQEAEEFVWAGHEADQAREIAAQMAAAVTWAQDVARACGAKVQSDSALLLPLGKAGGPATSASGGQESGALRRVSLARLEEVLRVAEVPCQEPHFPKLQAVRAQALALQARLKDALATQPPPSMKALHALHGEVSRSVHVQIPEAVLLKDQLVAAQAWIDAVRHVIPTSKAVRRKQTGAPLPPLQQLQALQAQGQSLRVRTAEHSLVDTALQCVAKWRSAASEALTSCTPLEDLEALLRDAEALPVLPPELPLLQARAQAVRDWAAQVAALRTSLAARASGLPAGRDVGCARADRATLEALLVQGRQHSASAPDVAWLEAELQRREWRAALAQALSGKCSPSQLQELSLQGQRLGSEEEHVAWLEATQAKAEDWERRAACATSACTGIAALEALAEEAHGIKAVLAQRKQVAALLASARGLQHEAQQILCASAGARGATGPGAAHSQPRSTITRAGQGAGHEDAKGKPKVPLKSIQVLVQQLQQHPVAIPEATALAALLARVEQWQGEARSALADISGGPQASATPSSVQQPSSGAASAEDTQPTESNSGCQAAETSGSGGQQPEGTIVAEDKVRRRLQGALQQGLALPAALELPALADIRAALRQLQAKAKLTAAMDQAQHSAAQPGRAQPGTRSARQALCWDGGIGSDAVAKKPDPSHSAPSAEVRLTRSAAARAQGKGCTASSTEKRALGWGASRWGRKKKRRLSDIHGMRSPSASEPEAPHLIECGARGAQAARALGWSEEHKRSEGGAQKGGLGVSGRSEGVQTRSRSAQRCSAGVDGVSAAGRDAQQERTRAAGKRGRVASENEDGGEKGPRQAHGRAHPKTEAGMLLQSRLPFPVVRRPRSTTSHSKAPAGEAGNSCAGAAPGAKKMDGVLEDETEWGWMDSMMGSIGEVPVVP